MWWWATAIATIAAAAMAAIVLAAGSRTASPTARAIAVAGSALLALAVSGVLAAATGALPVPVALAIASGALPMAAALATGAASVGTAGDSANSTRRVIGILGAALFGGVLVPVAIVGPAVFTASCPPTVCPVVDFAGALPFAVGVGAFMIVPAVIVRGDPGVGEPARAKRHPIVAVVLVAGCWAIFLVWLAALEGDVDEYTGRIALAGILSPAVGAVAWLIVDRVRGIAASTPRALLRGAVAGGAGILGCVVSIPLPMAALVGAVCGLAGALLHDARGLTRATPGVRAGLALLLVGTIDMVATGVIGTTYGFAFQARIDVLGYQLAATAAVAVLAVALSIPLAVLLRRATAPSRR